MSVALIRPDILAPHGTGGRGRPDFGHARETGQHRHPFFDKARTYLGVEPQPVAPVYAPEVVAVVILHAAHHPVRELIAGGAGAQLRVARFAPRRADLMERWTFDSPRTDTPMNGRSDNLYEPVPNDGGARGRNWSDIPAAAVSPRRR